MNKNFKCRDFTKYNLAFRLGCCDENRQMASEDVNLLEETNGTEYLEYSEQQCKTRINPETRNISCSNDASFYLVIKGNFRSDYE